MKQIILFLLLFFLGTLHSQMKITGQITGSDAEPLAFANIVVLHTDSTTYKGFTAEESGEFNLDLPNQPYILQFSYLGLRTESIPVSESQDLGAVILHDNARLLEKVTIAANRPAVQRLQDRLVVNVDGNIGSTGNNTLEILQKSPGIIVDQDGSISMGGRSGVRVYIDGKDTRLGGNQLAAVLEGMPASNIERIEIITNPSAKYEAQGNAGIIDIITKKGKFLGYNGNLNISPGLGQYFRWENGVNINYRTAKFNLYGQYSFAKRNQYMEIIIDRSFLENGVPTSDIDMSTLFRLPIENHQPRIGLDYFISDNTTLGVLVSGLVNLTGQDAQNIISAQDGNGDFLSNQTTDMETSTNWYQFTSNLNLKHRFNGGSDLDIDFDYARYDNNSKEGFHSTFLSPSGAPLLNTALLGSVDGSLDLKGFTIDYSMPFDKNNFFEIGWKNTAVNTDNDLLYLDVQNGEEQINANLTNRFLYDENIYAAYFNYRFNRKKMNGNIGLRGEHTDIRGIQVTTDEGFENSYFNLFPSLSFNYLAHPQLTLGLSASRRLDRPGYNDLNPFRFFVNNYTYRVGNPFLTPQFTWGTEINFTIRQRYYVAFNYGLITDNLTRAIIQDGNREEVIVTPLNIDDLQSFGLVISFPVQFHKKWNSQWNINASINEYKGVIQGTLFDQTNRILVLNTNHDLDIGKGVRIQLGGFYLPAHYATVSRINDISQITFGIQKQIMNKNGSLRLNINDIFYNGYPTGRTIFGSLDDTFISRRDSRYATLSFQWKFGKQTVQRERRRQTGIQEEIRRAAQNNN